MHAKFAISAGWALVAVVLFSCGGGSDDGDAPTDAQIKDFCIKSCQKLSGCFGLPDTCAADCAENGSGTKQIPPACKTNATLNKVQACLNESCTAVQSCLMNAVSGCSSGTGGSGNSTGGSGNSTGGSGNSTGGAGSGDCSACSKNPACCTALAASVGQDASSCSQSTVASCTAAGTQQATVIQACQQLVQTGALLNLAACK